MSRHYIIPIFVPHLGCPHDCVFCNQKRITGFTTDVTAGDVERIIEEHLTTFKPNSTIEVAFYGGSFTAIDIDIQKELLEIPYKYKIDGKINGIRLSTRPDAIDVHILDNLSRYSVDTIELGVQSLDDTVLLHSGRGHSSDIVYKSAKLIKEYGFNLGLQMMIGLPSDSFEKDLLTCKEFIKLSPFCVRIYPTLIIKDTFLEKLYIRGKYEPIQLEKAVNISAILLMMFTVNDINVIRIGLQPTENIQMGKDVIAGPFHPSFRQLVETRIFQLIFDKYLEDKNISTNGYDLIIEANKKQVSNIAGQKSSNIKYITNKYKFNKIKIYAGNLGLYQVNITIGEIYDKINMKSLMDTYLRDNSLFDLY
ncbi:MAG: radical SAM protein [Tissierellaceae bacterium]|nr:radical SAM protein [Tissierellaceae bacterium]